ncbi:MAG: CRISPR system precrRNA processing endoribonuclease RAMP protein Cas6, partial [Bacteroidota bacterium]
SEHTSVPVHTGRILNASFLRWLERDHPELVAQLHDANHPRPYTISNLQGPLLPSGERLKLAKGDTCWFRLTAMEEYFLECVHTSITKQKNGPQPDDRRLVPGPALQTREEHPWAAQTSFEQLAQTLAREAETHPLTHSLMLRFHSPTCFIENKQALPLPVPRYVFGYLVNKWQLASPFALPVDEVQHFVESIHLSHAQIETQQVDVQKYQRTGFIGEARFALHPALPENYKQALHLLAKFAFFSGVGSHTTMGMGQATHVPSRQ